VNLYKTGGGPPVQTELDDTELRVISSFKEQFIPLVNCFDDDRQYNLAPSLMEEVKVRLCIIYRLCCAKRS